MRLIGVMHEELKVHMSMMKEFRRDVDRNYIWLEKEVASLTGSSHSHMEKTKKCGDKIGDILFKKAHLGHHDGKKSIIDAPEVDLAPSVAAVQASSEKQASSLPDSPQNQKAEASRQFKFQLHETEGEALVADSAPVPVCRGQEKAEFDACERVQEFLDNLEGKSMELEDAAPQAALNQ
jgi:hypothetical protein